jgi:hypothetical protein
MTTLVSDTNDVTIVTVGGGFRSEFDSLVTDVVVGITDCKCLARLRLAASVSLSETVGLGQSIIFAVVVKQHHDFFTSKTLSNQETTFHGFLKFAKN